MSADALVVTRRSVLKGAGAILVTFSLPLVPRYADTNDSALPPGIRDNPTIDAWIRIQERGTVSVYTGKVELGQGLYTAFSQIVAEELDVALSRVSIVNADTDVSPVELPTFGSLSIEQGGAALRVAAAELRAHLLELAAGALDTSVESLTVRDGEILTPDGRRTSYWELLKGRDTRLPITGKARPKRPASYATVGQAVPRIDLPAKITARTSYLVDLRLPRMAHGRVVRPPSPGASLISVDEQAVRGMPGVLAVVRDGSFLGVVAEREHQAIRAADALRDAARWKETASLPEPQTIHDLMLRSRAETSVVAERGSMPTNGKATLTATYRRPLIAHGSIGPACAVAHFDEGRLTVWNHSQHPLWVRRDLAQVLRMPVERIRLIHMPHAGSYGHNGQDDVILDAALLARRVDRPVRVMWSRQDDLSWPPFGSPMIMRLTGTLDGDRRLSSLQHEVWSYSHVYQAGRQFLTGAPGTGLLAAQYLGEPYSPYKPADVGPELGGGGERNAVPIYDIPNLRVIKHFVQDMPLRMSSLRSLGAHGNVFALESFMDEAADLARTDPLEFRLRHLKDERWRELLQAVARLARWEGSSPCEGYGRGVAFAQYKNHAGALAIVIDAEIERSSGQVRVHRVRACADVGLAINPQGVRDQVEGGIIQSLSWTLKEQVTFDRRRVTSTDWSTYPILTIAEAPEITIEVINRPEYPAVGAGEMSQGPTAAAIANAIFHACGARVRDMPLTPERILERMRARDASAS